MLYCTVLLRDGMPCLQVRPLGGAAGVQQRTSNLLVATTCTAVVRPARAALLLLLLLRVAGMPAPLLDERRVAICRRIRMNKHSRAAGISRVIQDMVQLQFMLALRAHSTRLIRVGWRVQQNSNRVKQAQLWLC